MAAAGHMPIPTIAEVSDEEADRKTSPTMQRGEAWLLPHIQHTAGISGFFARLAQATRQEAEQTLCWWETGPMYEWRYRVHEQWYNLRPDALAEYRGRRQQMRFWLEWDRGTMNVRDLAVKFTAYAHSITSREWARERSMLPLLVCIAQGRRMHRVAQARLTSPPKLAVWTTTEVLLNEHGPLALIWLQGMPQPSQRAQAGGSFADQPRGAGSRSKLPIVMESATS